MVNELYEINFNNLHTAKDLSRAILGFFGGPLMGGRAGYGWQGETDFVEGKQGWYDLVYQEVIMKQPPIDRTVVDRRDLWKISAYFEEDKIKYCLEQDPNITPLSMRTRMFRVSGKDISLKVLESFTEPEVQWHEINPESQ